MLDGNEIAIDGLGIAGKRIAAEANARSGLLDLGRLGLEKFPDELFKLTHLRVLCLGEGYRQADGEWRTAATSGPPNRLDGELGRLSALPELRELSVAGMELMDLAALAGLEQIEGLDCARAPIDDLGPLAAFNRLRRLDFSGTSVRELAPLAALDGLRMLHLAYAPVPDLASLAGLRGLEHLDCSSTDIEDLSPLAGLDRLRVLDCSYTRVADLAPLAGLTALQRLLFAGTGVTDLAPMAGLVDLRWTDCSHTAVEDLAPLAGMKALQRLFCSGTQVGDLAPLSELTGLRVLFCADTRVVNLQPLSELRGLRALDCTGTEIASLAPLAGLRALQVLHCSRTSVADLAPLARLEALQVLYCSATSVSSLKPLRGLKDLQVLSCAQTEVAELTPLEGLRSLREFSCAGTKVTTLASLKSLAGLQWVSCSDTLVTELTPMAGMPTLQWLSCAASRVSDLAPLSGVRSLQWLDGSDCRLRPIPEPVLGLETLRELHLFRATVEQVPAEVLSQSKRDNCLAALRAHYADLAEGAEAVADVKLVILGNGRVGKTQLSRRLRDENFQEHWDSTHGIAVRHGALAGADGQDAARLQIWDFGGQDIYHGTHALFLRTRAVFVIAWAADVEATPEYEHQGIRFRNHTLDYWLEYVRQFGDRDSPVLIVQTKADSADDAVVPLPLEAAAREKFGHVRVLQYSSANDRGRDALNAALVEAVAWLRQPDRQGGVQTGAGRVRVRRRLEALRDADAERTVADRQWRSLARAEFLAICQEEGVVGSTEQLLSYLSNSGAVFHRRGLFHDRVVLDQAWALDAIYAVFQRDSCYREIVANGGMFTRPMLQGLIWRDYDIAEQKLFLSMMLSCGICFTHAGAGVDDDATQYVAPDLLVDREVVRGRLAADWDSARPVEEEIFTYRLLPPGMLRGLIARIGTSARANATYWRDGVQVYETTTRALARIEQETGADWSGRIRVSTQGPGAAKLLRRLATWVEDEQGNLGMNPEDVTRAGMLGGEEEPLGVFAAWLDPDLSFATNPIAART